MCLTSMLILLYQVVVKRPMISLQTPYGTKYIIVTNLVQTEMVLFEATAIESGHQPEQGLVGLPEMKETGHRKRGCCVSDLYDGLLYPDTRVAGFLCVGGPCNSALSQTVLSLMIGYWNMLSLALPTQQMVWQLPNF